MEPHIYNVDVRWHRDRMGVMCSPELKEAGVSGQSCIEVATPPQFDKGMEGIWSPEHLFTAAVSSCLMTTFLAIAEYSKLEYLDFKCSAKGILEKVDNQFMMTEVILEPVVTVENEKDVQRALRVLEKSEKSCLITNSVKAKVTMNPTVLVTETAG